MKRMLKLLIITISFYTWSYAQTFEQLNGPYGGRITSMVVDSATGNITIGTNGSGIYQSTDLGENWTPLNNGLTEYIGTGKQIWNLIVDPKNSNIMICNNSDYIFRSTDGGKNWEKKNFPGYSIRQLLLNYDIQLAFRPHLYILTEYGVYTSIDWGNTFVEPQDKNFDAHFMAANPHNPWFMIIDGALYDDNGNFIKRRFLRSTDAGANWTEINPPDTAYYVNSMIFESFLSNNIFASTLGGVFQSTDFGKNWKNLTKNLTENGIDGFSNLQFGLDSKQLFTAIDLYGIYKYNTLTGFTPTQNDGLMTKSIQTDGKIFTTDQRPGKKNFYLGTKNGGMYISTDASASWTIKNNGIKNFYTQSIAIDPYNSNIIYCGSYGTGIYKSTDGGDTWNTSNNGIKLQAGDIYYSINSLAVDPTNSQVVYAGVYGYGLWKSTDAGNNWKQAFSSAILNQEGSGSITWILIHPKDPSIVYTCAYGNLFKSTDRGVSWQVSSTGLLGCGDVWDMVINPKDPNVMYVASGSRWDQIKGGIWKSTNAGASWSITSLNGTYLDCFALAMNNQNPDIIYAGTGDGVYLSTNAGSSWSKQDGGDLGANEARSIVDIFVDQRNPLNIYCASSYSSAYSYYTGIYKSSDGGQNWKWLSRNTLTRNVQIFGSDLKHPGILLVGSSGGGIYQMVDPKFGAGKDTINYSLTGVNVSVEDSVTVYSYGFGQLKVTNVYISGNAASEFSITSGGNVFNLDPGQSRVIKIKFTPKSTGNKTASLFFDCNDPRSPYEIVLFGRGVQDTKAPTITHTPVTTVALNSNLSITANAADEASDIKSFNVYYRTTNTAWSDINKKSIGSGKSPVSGTVTIPVSSADGLDYRIIAVDDFGNIDTLKVNGLSYVSVAITIPAESVTSPATTAGTDVNAYRIFSIPFNFATRSASSFFGSFGQYMKDWRFRVFQGSSFIDGQNSQLEVGKGYFLITKTSKTIRPSSEGTSSKYSDYSNTGIVLNSGWNLIGDPFNFNVDISKIKLSSGGAFSAYAFLGSTGWQKDQPLQPWSGLAINVQSADVLKFNLYGSSLLKTESVKVKNDKKNWSAQVIVKNDIMMDQENYFGMQEISLNERDNLDAVEPPILEDGVAAYFPHSDWKKYPENYAEDYRPVDENGAIWDLVVQSANNKILTLEFKNLNDIPSKFKRYVVDIDRKFAYDLSKDEKILTNSNEGKRYFRIVIGTDIFISKNCKDIQLIPTEFDLSQNYPNPFNPLTTVRLALPFDSHIKLIVYDSYGRLVSTLIDENKTAGYYEIPFDASNLASGVYYYKAIVQGGKSFVSTKKMMLIK